MLARQSGEDFPPLLLSRSHMSSAAAMDDVIDTEAVHKHALALATAQAEHQRVRESALRAYKNNELREAQDRLRRIQIQEVERLKLEAERAELAAKVLELRRKQVPVPAPPTPIPPPSAQPSKSAGSPRQLVAHYENPSSQQKAVSRPPTQKASPRPRSPLSPPEAPAAPEPVAPRAGPPQVSVALQNSAALQPFSASSPSTKPPFTSISAPPNPVHDLVPPHVFPESQKYLDIHKRLKQIRTFIVEYAKQDAALKKKMGEMRREIRKSVGQLTEGRGANKTPMRTIVDIFKDALLIIPSPPVDPTMVMLSTPRPVEGAHNNGDTLPALFIYLLNIFSKAVISQFMDEAGVSPKAADPIGVIAVSIFAQADLCWRGTSLIDILLCKMRVVCPVLFGIRGNEKTEEGRARLGWWRNEGGDWVSDQVHNTRMTGLGAGYAAISLRDFSKSSNKNPFPPSKYWQTMSSIVNTPPEEASSTQYTVLKAMIENYEQRFMNFYGSAARAALQVALVDFPGRAQETTVAMSSLKVLGDKLRRDVGLNLKPYSATRA